MILPLSIRSVDHTHREVEAARSPKVSRLLRIVAHPQVTEIARNVLGGGLLHQSGWGSLGRVGIRDLEADIWRPWCAEQGVLITGYIGESFLQGCYPLLELLQAQLYSDDTEPTSCVLVSSFLRNSARDFTRFMRSLTPFLNCFRELYRGRYWRIRVGPIWG